MGKSGKPNRNSYLPLLAIFLCTFIGASTIVVAEPLVKIVSPFFLLALRFLLAASILALALPKKVFPISKKAMIAGIATGLGFGVGCALLYLALPHVRAGKVTFLIALEVVIVPLVCFVCFKQKISNAEKLALIPAVIGLWLITGDADSAFSWWELLALLSAFAYSVYTISLSHTSNAESVFSRTFVSFILIGALSTVISFCFESISEIIWTAPAIAGLAYLVIIGSFARFIIQGWAQKQVSAPITALTFSAEPVFTIALSYIFLNERFTPLQSIGAVAILTALLLANVPMSNSARSHQNTPRE